MTPTEAEGQQHQPTERHVILIQEFCVRRGRFRRRRFQYAVQNVSFDFWLRITNRGNKVFPGATLRNLKIKSAEIAVGHLFGKEFAVGPLNPGVSAEIFTVSMSTPVNGPVWVECDVVPTSGNYVIDTYVSDAVTGGVSELSMGVNFWRDIWFIQDHMETQQARTNAFLLLLAILTFLQGVVGLRELANYLMHAFGNVLLWIARLLGADGVH